MMKDFVIASVGGQGGLLATTVLSAVFVDSGYDVKTSEVHGMAQRGGTVTSYVRRGRNVRSPMVPKGGADLILGLEILEAYRELPNLKVGGCVLTSDEVLYPLPVIMGDAEYPNLDHSSFRQRAEKAYILPALDIAQEAGNPRTSNVVCLGALSALLDGPGEPGEPRVPGEPGGPGEPGVQTWEDAVSRLVPKKTVEVNLTAFRLGREWMMKNR